MGKQYIFKKPCKDCVVMMMFGRCRNMDCGERLSDKGDIPEDQTLPVTTGKAENNDT